MICSCSLAGTSACNSCFYNPNQQAHINNFITWINFTRRISHIEYPFYEDAPVINGQPRCSECKTEFEVGAFPNYCPNCGAKMVGE